jgi:hypothetical protein
VTGEDDGVITVADERCAARIAQVRFVGPEIVIVIRRIIGIIVPIWIVIVCVESGMAGVIGDVDWVRDVEGSRCAVPS